MTRLENRLEHIERVSVAQLGARMHYAVPRILHRSGLLERLYTDISGRSGPARLLRLVPPGLRPAPLQGLLDRVPGQIPADRITAFNLFGLRYAWRRHRGRNATAATAAHLWAGQRFNELVVRKGRGRAQAVYAYNSACRELFRLARERGVITVMEQTIAPRLAEQRILDAEYAEAPSWGNRQRDALAQDYGERERAEWELADVIVCGSDFVRDQIGREGGPVQKCTVVPYGVERPVFARERPSRRRDDRFRILFLGKVGLRKGVRYLLEAMESLRTERVTCRIVGSVEVDTDVLGRAAGPNVETVGPVPRSAVADEYARADVFCLPSLCEGSATVVYEALAAGLPVITTPNAGSIVRDGREGFIVPVRDAEAIASRIDELASDDALRQEMARAARERSRYGSLDAYARRLLAVFGRSEGATPGPGAGGSPEQRIPSTQ